jgi:hypothetical protein
MNEVKNSLETGDNVYLRGLEVLLLKLELKNWKKYLKKQQ